MHKYYDRRAFDMLEESDVLAQYAPKGVDGNPEDAKTIGGLVESGFDVSCVGPGCGEGDDAVAAGDEDVGEPVVDADMFKRWLELSQLPLGKVVGKWWNEQEPSPEGCAPALRHDRDECSADFLGRIRDELAAEGKTDAEGVPLRALVLWLRENVGGGFNVEGDTDEEALADQMQLELEVVHEDLGAGALEATGGMEAPAGGEDLEREGLDIARGMVHGWPSVDKDPTGAKQVGRFVKSFPLKFPMGVGDLYEDRPRAVRGPEWLQHMLRLGHVTEGEDCDRCVWAMVNTILISEAAGKGFAVQRAVMRRRFGGRGADSEVLTKRRLRELLADEEAARAMVYNLQNIGRDVRSTPMQWSYEGKKLDAAMKYLSWRPPWLEVQEGDVEDPATAFLGENSRVPDRLGHGRIPALWWTSNCAYNKAYEVHRLNVDGSCAREALVGPEDRHGRTRFDFVRTAPDIAITMVSLRTELEMKIVMPAIVPHTEKAPFLPMARFECGAGGNPHHHGFAFGAGNPRLGRVEVDVEGAGDLPPKTPEVSSDGESPAEGDGEGEKEDA